MENKKDLYFKLIIILLIIATFIISGILLRKANDYTKTNINVVPTFKDQINSNSIWVPSLQLAWNDAQNELVGQDIPTTNKYLNSQSFKSSDISSTKYYKVNGYQTPQLKKEIETNIKTKFGEKSNILDKFDWTNQSTKYLFYSMLVSKMEFPNAFDSLNISIDNYIFEGFGINSTSSNELRNQVKVIFYRDENNYAVKLLSSSNDEIFLLKTEEIYNSFEQAYKELSNNLSYSNFLDNDVLKVHNFSLKVYNDFSDLINQPVVCQDGTIVTIDKIVQAISFQMNNFGAQVVSEAGISSEITGDQSRDFIFDNNFYIFVKESNYSFPYMALKIDDLKQFN